MSKLPLYIFLLVSLELIFVASQGCTEPDNCENGSCCRNGFCTTECDDFCYENWECDSGCCKDNKCQDTYATTAPNLLNSCHYDCGDYGECCIKGECCSCNQTTTLPSREYPIENVNYDEYYEDSDSSGSNLGTGAIVGIVIAAAVLGIIIRFLLRYYYCRRERVIVVHRRTTCVRVPLLEDDEVQREQERAEQVIPARQPPAYHPRPFQDNPENPALEPAPAYTSTSRINPNQTSRINPNQTTSSAQSVGNNRNTNNVDGAHQDHRMVPPPEVSQRHSASSGQSTNSVQTYQTQGVTNNAKQTSGVPQGSLGVPQSSLGVPQSSLGVPHGSLGVPPSTNPASRLPNTS